MCTVTNNISLLCKVKWYTRLFRPPWQMIDSPYEKTSAPEAKVYIQAPPIQEGKYIAVFHCYPNKFKHEYGGQLMFKLSFEARTSVMPENLHNDNEI